MQQFSALLTDKKSFPGDVFLLRFTPQNTRFDFLPGQYVILSVPQGEKTVKRLYSVASAPGQPDFELLIKLVPGGASSGYIHSLGVGATVEMQGPAGLFTLKDTPRTKVFIATGTGFAPMRSFLYSNPLHKEPYHLVWGLPLASELYLFEEISSLAAKDPLFHPQICLSREQNLEAIEPQNRRFFVLGHVNDALQPLFTSQPQDSLEFYICGRREMIESLREYLYNHNIDKDRVFFERY